MVKYQLIDHLLLCTHKIKQSSCFHLRLSPKIYIYCNKFVKTKVYLGVVPLDKVCSQRFLLFSFSRLYHQPLLCQQQTNIFRQSFHCIACVCLKQSHVVFLAQLHELSSREKGNKSNMLPFDFQSIRIAVPAFMIYHTTKCSILHSFEKKSLDIYSF